MFSCSQYLETNSMSLLERKKQQWAREREELANLQSVWSSRTTDHLNRQYERIRHKTPSNRADAPSEDCLRRPSLPPLYRNQYNSYDRGGETSGYGSDCNPTPEHSTQRWRNNSETVPHVSGYESSSSYSRDDRPKWGDKGVGVGKFWQPKEESLERIVSGNNDPPNWVKRGLQDGEILVSNNSPAVSPEQRYDTENGRPCTSSSYSRNRSFIRGQNVPLDSIEMAERERRRQIAMAHQEAIRQQLEERERIKQAELERRMQEEKEEELRIEREKEYERKRREEEERLQQEKLERERKRREAMREAMELAEKEAKLEKMRLKMSKKNDTHNNNISENLEEKNKVPQNVRIDLNNEQILNNINKVQSDSNNNINNNNILNKTNNNTNNAKLNNIDVCTAQNPSPDNTNSVSPRSINIVSTPSTPSQGQHNTDNVLTATPRILTTSDNIALLLQPSAVHFLEALNNLQYPTVLLPNSQLIPIATAVPAQTLCERSSVVSTARTENRVLTPTQYRRGTVSMCDSSTQTESSSTSSDDLLVISSSNNSRENSEVVDINNSKVNSGRDNKARPRRRSQSVGERPKWGANRPPTRYLKQSEKDLVYQRRKLRQKPIGDDMNRNSSDESRECTPRFLRKNEYIEKKHHSRGVWRKNNHIMTTRNVRMYQTEIVPLGTDRDHLYYKCCQCLCQCDRFRDQRQARDEHFEYQNISERSSREVLPQIEIFNDETKTNLLGKLSSLQSGLILEQEKWENSHRSPLHSDDHSKQ